MSSACLQRSGDFAVSVNCVQQAVDAYEKREIDIARLIAVALEEIEQSPDHRQAVISEVTSAFQNGTLSAKDLEDIVAALAGGRTAMAQVREVSLDPEAETVYAASMQEQAAAGGGRARRETPVQPAAESAADRPTIAVAPAVNLQPKSQLEPGDVLNRRFELLEVIGEGGMGRVFRARDRDQTGRKNPFVALKVLSESFSAHPDSLAALRREANSAMELSHDNIVNVRDYAEDKDGGHYYIVMEYLRGSALDEFRSVKANQTLSFDKAWPIIRGIGDALGYAHGKGIIHSDVKPSNVWITDKGDVKLLDFGIARAADPDTQTKFQGIEALSPRYASPEQHRREEPDARDDVYGLACVAYELISSQHPFDGSTAMEAEADNMSPKRPEGLKGRQWKALERGLQFSRTARTATVTDFLEGLAPERKARPWPRIAGAAILSALLVPGVLYFTGILGSTSLSDEDVYINYLLDEPLKFELSEQETDDLLEEGWAYMEWGKEDLIGGEYQRGNAQLKNGVSTAFRPFYKVIVGTNDEVHRRAAADGLVALHQAYAEAVESLVASGLTEKALWLSCQGLSTPPDTNVPYWPSLYTLFEGLWEKAKGTPVGPIGVSCDAMGVPDSWGDSRHLRSPYS